MGEAPDACKFLQENAEPGEIIISAATYDLVKDHFAAEAVAARQMKPGFEGFETIYRLVGDVGYGRPGALNGGGRN